MFFFNRRKKYNGSVSALLPAFGIDLEEAGVMSTLNVLDVAWQHKYNQYEGALLVAYSFAAGLYNIDPERANSFVENMMFIQADWIKKDLVRDGLVKNWPAALMKRTHKPEADESSESDEPYPLSPSMPDVTKRSAEFVHAVGEYLIIFVKNPPTMAESSMGQTLPMHYSYVMVVVNSESKMPQYFVTLETGITGSSFLCIFDRNGIHKNLGEGADYSDESMFVEKALDLIGQEFGFDNVIKNTLPDI